VDLIQRKMNTAAMSWARLAVTHWVSMGKPCMQRLNVLPTQLHGAGQVCVGLSNVDTDDG